MVLHDGFLGNRRFDGFERPLGITRPVLADHLCKLVKCAVLKRAVISSGQCESVIGLQVGL